MLNFVPKKASRASGFSIAIVASRYNGRYVDAMLRAARAELKRAGVKKVRIVRVPGAFEIPVVTSRLARKTALRPSHPELPAAITCLGVILRGQTSHAAHIGE